MIYCIVGCIDEYGGAAGLLLKSLKSCNHDVRSAVVHNIIFCGGGSMIPGILKKLTYYIT